MFSVPYRIQESTVNSTYVTGFTLASKNVNQNEYFSFMEIVWMFLGHFTEKFVVTRLS